MYDWDNDEYVVSYLGTVVAVATKEDLCKVGLPVNHDVITIENDDKKGTMWYIEADSQYIRPAIEDLYIVNYRRSSC